MRRSHDLRPTLIVAAALHTTSHSLPPVDPARAHSAHNRQAVAARPAQQFSQRESFSRRPPLREQNNKPTRALRSEYVPPARPPPPASPVKETKRSRTLASFVRAHQPVTSVDPADAPPATRSHSSRVSSLKPTSARPSCRTSSAPVTLVRGFGRAARSYCAAPRRREHHRCQNAASWHTSRAESRSPGRARPGPARPAARTSAPRRRAPTPRRPRFRTSPCGRPSG